MSRRLEELLVLRFVCQDLLSFAAAFLELIQSLLSQLGKLRYHLGVE